MLRLDRFCSGDGRGRLGPPEPPPTGPAVSLRLPLFQPSQETNPGEAEKSQQPPPETVPSEGDQDPQERQHPLTTGLAVND